MNPPEPQRAIPPNAPRASGAWATLALGLAFVAARPATADWTDDYINGLMRSNSIPAVAIAVVTNGVVAKAQGYGAGVSPTSVFQLDSVTKQFTATLIMQRIGQGRLATNTLVGSILTNAPVSWAGITLAHLLSHTAGLSDAIARGRLSDPWQQNLDPFPFLPTIYATPLVSTNPGACYLYSDAGYYTLGAVLEQVTGQRYSDLLQTEIFTPAGMTQSVVLDPSQVPTNRVVGHYGSGQVVSPQLARPVFSGGAIQASLNDLIAWDKALRELTVLDQAALDQMWTPWDRPACGQPNGQPQPYGFGWSINALSGGGRLVHHNGGGFGYATAIYRWLGTPDGDVTIIVLTNKDAASKSEPEGWQPGPDAVAKQVYAQRGW